MWFLNVRKNVDLRVSENNMCDLRGGMRVVYGKPPNEEFHNLQSPTNIRGIKGREMKGTRKVKPIWKLTMHTESQLDISNGVRTFGNSTWRLE
jgi:hypothetical protein